MDMRFLFISTPLNRTYADVLATVLSPYGKLNICTWQEMPDLIGYTLIFLDAGILADLKYVKSLTELLGQLFSYHPQARVLVTTSSPTWKRARDALVAGAVDYIRQTLDPNSLYNTLLPTLKRYLPDTPAKGG
jgi:DNA-binding NarL/FixJ family response regulator